MKKFQNKYRIPSARAQWCNYGDNGAYFITICTAHRECFFGNIINGIMKLSHLGVLADVFIQEIKNHAKNVIVDEYVVMPNHVHFIVKLDDNKLNDTLGSVHSQVSGGSVTHEMTTHVETTHVETTHALSLQQQQPQQQPHKNLSGQNRFQNQGKNTISSIVGSYKSAVSKHAHRLGYDFGWQSRFYDNIIRNQESYNTISEYITNNPAKWEDDKFYPSKPKTII